MRKTREILRLKWKQGRSHRQIAKALGVGKGTTSEVVGRAKRAKITCWHEVDALTDEELDARLYPPSPSSSEPRPVPNGATIHIELRRTGVTLRLLHEEYLLANANGYAGNSAHV